MARMFNNAEIPRRDYGDSLKLINCILDSDVTYQITQDISDFILSSLVETDKYIKVADGHFVTEKKKEKFKWKCVKILENPSLLRYILCYWH